MEQTLLPVIPPDRAAAFTQALMELGATVCLPNGEPRCPECPWASFCEAKKQGIADRLPRKSKTAKRRIEDHTVLLIRDGEKIVLQKRPPRGLLAGMYEFPHPRGRLTEKEALQAVRDLRLHPLHIRKLADARHIFSHVEWHMSGYMIRVDSLTRDSSDMLFVELQDARAHYPIPSAFAAYTDYLFSAQQTED